MFAVRAMVGVAGMVGAVDNGGCLLLLLDVAIAVAALAPMAADARKFHPRGKPQE